MTDVSPAPLPATDFIPAITPHEPERFSTDDNILIALIGGAE